MSHCSTALISTLRYQSSRINSTKRPSPPFACQSASGPERRDECSFRPEVPEARPLSPPLHDGKHLHLKEESDVSLFDSLDQHASLPVLEEQLNQRDLLHPCHSASGPGRRDEC